MAERDPNGSPARVLVVMIVSNADILDDLATALLDLGLGATIMESRGLMSLVREEMPIFSGLAAMMSDTTGSRVVMSITTEERADGLLELLERDFRVADRPITVVVPVLKSLGGRV